MTRARSARVALAVTTLLALVALALAVLRPKPRTRVQSEPSPLATMAPFDVGDEHLRIGAASVVGNVTVFPIFSQKQAQLGPIVSLQSALADKTAEVREHGADDPDLSSATVNQLVIENKGDVPIYVLAGTIVKGGKQDRQIGQDFVVEPHSVASVDAFCVEHGRWTGSREGVATGGKFEALKQLATTKVRAAGQYESNQGEVWAEVAKVNAEHGKEAPSGTLLATVDDSELSRRRERVAKDIGARLADARPDDALVGMAYAVGGKVRGVRWFANRDLFAMFREVLVNTAAMDAVSAKPERGAGRVDAAQVVSFVKDVDRAATEEKVTPAGNVNEYKKAAKGWGSATKLKRRSKAAPISKDYVAK
jgi:hypothetical protein